MSLRFGFGCFKFSFKLSQRESHLTATSWYGFYGHSLRVQVSVLQMRGRASTSTVFDCSCERMACRGDSGGHEAVCLRELRHSGTVPGPWTLCRDVTNSCGIPAAPTVSIASCPPLAVEVACTALVRKRSRGWTKTAYNTAQNLEITMWSFQPWLQCNGYTGHSTLVIGIAARHQRKRTLPC